MTDDHECLTLKSMELDTNDIPDMSMVQLRKARMELRDIAHDDEQIDIAQIQALVLLNTEIAIHEN